VYEYVRSSEKIMVVDLSSEDEDNFPDTSRDEKITRKLFGDLNRDLLGPPCDDNVIILSNSNEEEEVHKEDATDIEVAPSSTINTTAPIVSADDNADDAPDAVQDDSNGGRTPDRA
jgi:hypothetical protein